MALIVQKYGGTSVANPERIRHVARYIVDCHDQGNQVVAVVSARAKQTDELIAMAREICPEPSPRELDMLLSIGEQMSCALMAMAIHALGRKAVSLTGSQVGIRTDNIYSKAKIKEIDNRRILNHLANGEIVVVAGFQGVDDFNNITTLGRGGSDTTAVAIAAAIKADVCDIYTDVEGVYTADPRIVPEARLIKRICYDELLEMASLGAKVMHSRAVEIAKRFDVPFRVRSSFTLTEGTFVCKEVPEMEKITVRGAAVDKNEAKITIRGVTDKPGVAARIFGEIAAQNLNVDMIIQNISANGRTDVSFTVTKADLPKALKVANKIKDEIEATEVLSDDKIAKISVVGIGMRSHTGVAEKMFRALAEAQVNIQMISTSEIKISCVINENKADEALRAVHKAFELDKVE